MLPDPQLAQDDADDDDSNQDGDRDDESACDVVYRMESAVSLDSPVFGFRQER